MLHAHQTKCYLSRVTQQCRGQLQRIINIQSRDKTTLYKACIVTELCPQTADSIKKIPNLHFFFHSVLSHQQLAGLLHCMESVTRTIQTMNFPLLDTMLCTQLKSTVILFLYNRHTCKSTESGFGRHARSANQIHSIADYEELAGTA